MDSTTSLVKNITGLNIVNRKHEKKAQLIIWTGNEKIQDNIDHQINIEYLIISILFTFL